MEQWQVNTLSTQFGDGDFVNEKIGQHYFSNYLIIFPNPHFKNIYFELINWIFEPFIDRRPGFFSLNLIRYQMGIILYRLFRANDFFSLEDSGWSLSMMRGTIPLSITWALEMMLIGFGGTRGILHSFPLKVSFI